MTDNSPSESEEIEEWWEKTKSLNGKSYYEPTGGWFHTANLDTTRIFARAIGDKNPLWTSPEYGERSIHNTCLVPPLFLYCVSHDVLHGPPEFKEMDYPWYWGGTEFTWYEKMTMGDTYTGVRTQKDTYRKEGSKGEMFFIETETEYKNQHDDLVAEALGTIIMIANKYDMEEATIYPEREDNVPYEYSDEELEEIERGIQNETIRGDDIRYWEDVDIGESLTPVVKGPLTMGDMVLWLAAWNYPGGAVELNHPSNAPIKPYIREHPITGAWVNAEDDHLDPVLAKYRGLPGPFDNGPQRVGYAQHLITNWMGDAGFLKNLSIQVNKPNFYGDTTWFYGEITSKTIESGEHLVNINIEGINQLDEVTTEGSATVRLPSLGWKPTPN